MQTSHHTTLNFKNLVITRLIAENVLTFLLQYIGLMFIGPLTPFMLAPVWFSSGTAVAFIFLRGYTVLPGILLGSFCAYCSAQTFSHAAISSITLTLQATLLLFLCYRQNLPSLVFYDRKKYLQFVLMSTLLTGLVSFILAALFYAKLSGWMMFLKLGLLWWLGNLNGILIFAVGIATLDWYFSEIDGLKKMKKPVILYFGLFIIFITVLTLSNTFMEVALLSLLSLPLLIGIIFRFGQCGLSAAVFLFALTVNLAAYLGVPIFTTQFSLVTLIFIQTFLLLTTVLGNSTTVIANPVLFAG